MFKIAFTQPPVPESDVLGRTWGSLSALALVGCGFVMARKPKR